MCQNSKPMFTIQEIESKTFFDVIIPSEGPFIERVLISIVERRISHQMQSKLGVQGFESYLTSSYF